MRETGCEGECRGVWTGRVEEEERELTIDSGEDYHWVLKAGC